MSKKDKVREIEYVDQLLLDMDASTRKKFRGFEQASLVASMGECGMGRLPKVSGDRDGWRVSSKKVCSVCGKTYARHPEDWRLTGYGDAPIFKILCDGQRLRI